MIVTTHVELYKALEPHVGDMAAQMIADMVPSADNIATKEDVQIVVGEIHALEARIFRWGLAAMIPLWVGVWGSLGVLLVDALRR